MNYKHGLYCPSAERVYKYWSKYNLPLARQVDDLIEKYEAALTLEGMHFYESNILELSCKQVGLMKIYETVASEGFRRPSNGKKPRASNHFWIIFKKEDEVRHTMLSLGFISETENNNNKNIKTEDTK
jgi:hypothetical protein